jgi:NADP-dependent 3-hydroxy acid dehydrogenase YdfG
VVGSTGGIGRAVADALHATHEVWLVHRGSPKAPNLAGDASFRTWCVDLEADLTELTPPEELTQVDLLVLAAGRWLSGTLAEGSAGDWSAVLTVNAIGQIALTQSLLPHLRRAHGRVIALSSTAVDGSPRGRSAYIASKAALGAFLGGLHEEERHHGIQVTTVYAGRVATSMHRAVTNEESTAERVEAMTSEDLAGVIVMLAEAPSSVHISQVTVRAASYESDASL